MRRRRPRPRHGCCGSRRACSRDEGEDCVLAWRSGRWATRPRAAGGAVAATMLGTAVTVSWSLRTGFDRSAEAADLPDIVARFDREPEAQVAERLRALPNVAATSLRAEITHVP